MCKSDIYTTTINVLQEQLSSVAIVTFVVQSIKMLEITARLILRGLEL